MRVLGLLAALLGVVGGAICVSLPLSVRSASAAGAEDADPFELAEVEYVLLDDVHPGVGGEAVVDLYFRALTRYRLPVEDLRAVDLAVLQDGRRVPERSIVSLRRVDEADLGVACVVALDTSRTMMGSPFEGAKEAALRFLELLQASDRSTILAFSDRVEVVAGFDTPPEAALEALGALEPHRNAMSTLVYDAVYESARLLRESQGLPRRTFAVVFSDGRDGGSSRSFDDVVQIARGGPSEPRIPVFTIGYTGRGDDGLTALRRIAARTGADSTRAVDLAEFYDDVLQQMRRSYVLRFETDMDGAPHEIVLDVEGHNDSRLAAYPAVFSTQSALWSPVTVAAVATVLGAGALLVGRIQRGRIRASLLFVDGPRAAQKVPVRKDRIRIGALDENDVVIPVRSVSRFHAEILRRDDEYTLVDLDSTNGTRLNGARVTRGPLRTGDRIRIGEVELVFET